MDPLVTGNVSNTNASSQTISMHKHTNIIISLFAISKLVSQIMQWSSTKRLLSVRKSSPYIQLEISHFASLVITV